MQRTQSNSAETYIVSKPIAVRPIKADIPGEGASGPPVSVVSGVCAVEEMPTRNLFGLCTAEDCISSCEDGKFVKPDRGSRLNRNNEGDTIIGITERCPGESHMSASAVETEGQAASTSKPQGLVYSATDFRPYGAR